MHIDIIPTKIFIPYIWININPQIISWIDLNIVRRSFIILFKNIGIFRILKNIVDDSIPKIAPKIILINQLKKAIKTVSFNLLITEIIIVLSILGLNAENMNSRNKLNPPNWKLVISWYARGIQTSIGKNDIEMLFNFNLCNDLIYFL